MKLPFSTTTYRHDGETRLAVLVLEADLVAFLGHEHEGGVDDDLALEIAVTQSPLAPEWAALWITDGLSEAILDTKGWYLLGPIARGYEAHP